MNHINKTLKSYQQYLPNVEATNNDSWISLILPKITIVDTKTMTEENPKTQRHPYQILIFVISATIETITTAFSHLHRLHLLISPSSPPSHIFHLLTSPSSPRSLWPPFEPLPPRSLATIMPPRSESTTKIRLLWVFFPCSCKWSIHWICSNSLYQHGVNTSRLASGRLSQNLGCASHKPLLKRTFNQILDWEKESMNPSIWSRAPGVAKQDRYDGRKPSH